MSIDPNFTNIQPIYPCAGLTYEEKIKKIFAHELEFRGIDWLQLHEQGTVGMQKAKQLAHAHLMNFQNELGLTANEIPPEVQDMLRSMLPSTSMDGNGADVMPNWAITEQYATQWQNATGGLIKDLVATQISSMQSIQTVHDEPSAIVAISLGLGVAAWLRTAWTAFQAARALAAATEAYAVLMGVIEAGPAIVVFAVTTVILAVLIPILLLMLKDATCYMVILNRSSDDLILDGDVDLTHGNLNVQFVDFTQKRRIPQITPPITDPNGHIVANAVYWLGILVAQKKSGALVGSQGAFKFASTTSFPSGLYIGWEIPLTLFGGYNRCLVAADFTGELGTFSNNTDRHGVDNSISTISTGSIVGRMNQGGGSQGYMVVVAGPALVAPGEKS